MPDQPVTADRDVPLIELSSFVATSSQLDHYGQSKPSISTKKSRWKSKEEPQIDDLLYRLKVSSSCFNYSSVQNSLESLVPCPMNVLPKQSYPRRRRRHQSHNEYLNQNVCSPYPNNHITTPSVIMKPQKDFVSPFNEMIIKNNIGSSYLYNWTIRLWAINLIIICTLHAGYAFILSNNPRAPIQNSAYPKGIPWPMPQTIKIDPKVFYTLNPETLVITSNLQCDLLEHAFERYANLMFGDESIRMDIYLPLIAKINLVVRSRICESLPHPDMDESYEIHYRTYHHPDPKLEKDRFQSLTQELNQVNRITDSASFPDLNLSGVFEVRILSQSVWGALRGLESFSQMISTSQNNTYQVPKHTIFDAPRFKYRGLLIDTARHFLPMSVLKQILDGMSYNKLNVFHWHIVDDQSFPFESKTFPELSQKGAYSPSHVYKTKDVSAIVKYASLRGIRVIPEFDTPGHTFSWGKSHPELLTSCFGDGRTRDTARHPYHAAKENLDPLSEHTYAFVERLFREIFAAFPDPYFHAGMDETYPACWRSNPFINNLTSPGYYDPYKIAMDYYINRTLNIIYRYNKRVIIWEDPIEDNIKIAPNVTLQVWKNWGFQVSLGHKINRYATQGYKIIISAPWYLDEEYHKEDWKRFYTYEPEASLDLETFKNNASPIVGGEACMWAEYVDGSSISDVIWPRACAVAERLWSSRVVTNAEAAVTRLDEHRCRMVKRGVNVRPIKPGFCGDYEYGMKESFKERENSAPFYDNAGSQWILLPS